jgi:hypothetical protein
MTQTATAIQACDVDIELDDDAGVEKNIKGSSNSLAMNFDKDVKPFRTFASRWPKRLECGKDASFTLGVVYTSAADEAFDLLKTWYFEADPGERTLNVYIPKKNVGADFYAGEFRLKSLTWTLSPDEAGPVMAQVVLEPSGEITLATNTT